MGDNFNGQIGNSTAIDQLIPTKVLSNVVSASMKGGYSSAITTNGDLYCWGLNQAGQVGNGTTIDQFIPAKILSDVVFISRGGLHSAAITTNGDLYCWGCNYNGQIGNGTTKNQYTPIKVLSNVVSVSMGHNHSSAITATGDLYCWGDNTSGQIGNGTTKDQLIPTKVLSNVVSASMGYGHSSAITANGDLYCWGYNAYGSVGNRTRENQNRPTKVMSDIVFASMEDYYSSAITANGDLYCWGYRGVAQLKEHEIDIYTTIEPTKILSNVIFTAKGIDYGSAVTKNGDLYCWGDNDCDEVGNGTTEYQFTPVKVMNIGIPKITCQQNMVLTEGTKNMLDVKLNAKNEQELDDIANGLTVTSSDFNVCTAKLEEYVKNDSGGPVTQGTYFVELVGNNLGNTEITVSAGDGTSVTCQVTVTEFNEYLYRADYYSDDSNTGAKWMDSQLHLETPCEVLNRSAEEAGLKNSVDAWNTIKTVFDTVDDPSSLGDVTVRQKDIYAALLMNLLESSYTYSTVNQQVKEAAKLDKQFVSSIKDLMEINYKIDIYDANDFKNLTFEQKKALSGYASEWFAAEFRIFDSVGDILTGITIAFDTVGSIEDYYNRVASCIILYNMSEDMKAVLRQVYNDSKTSANPHLRQALQDCVEIIDSSAEEFIEKMVMEGVTTVGVNTGKWLFVELFWDDIKTNIYVAYPVTAVLMATYKGVSFAVNGLFSTDKISEQYLKMLAMEDIEDLLDITYQNVKNTYANARTQDNAGMFLSSMELISMAMNEDCKQAYTFTDIVDNATANKIAHFFGASDNSETKDTIRYMQKQFGEQYKTNSMKWMEHLSSRLYTYYNNLYLESYRKRVKQITAACPVDVYVYDNVGTLVASSVDDVLSCSSDDISIVRIGDEKTFLFYDDQNYQIEYVGNGSGVMDVTVKEYDENETEIRNVNYYDVALDNGKTYEMPVEGQNLSMDSYRLNEKNVYEKIEKDYDSMADNLSYKAKISHGSMVYREGMFLETDVQENESVEIHACVPEGKRFVRWESSAKNNIFADALSRDTKFVMPAENCEITAILEQDNSGGSNTPPDNGNDGNNNLGTIYLDTTSEAIYIITNDNPTSRTVSYLKTKVSSGTLKVPNSIKFKGETYKVTKIGNDASADNAQITKVIIGKNVTSIGKGAFSGCSKLKTLKIGKNVTSIKNGAFSECVSLEQVVIPSKVKTIGGKAFYGCSNLKKLTIKSTKLTKKSIGSKAFSSVSQKITVKVPENKLMSYKKILKKKGIGKRARIK